MNEHHNNPSDQKSRTSVLDLLLEQYENDPEGGSTLSNALFNELCRELRSLDPESMEHILSLTCTLCGEHGRSGYVAGLKDGAHLIMELQS